jgi:hypothetical protein
VEGICTVPTKSAGVVRAGTDKESHWSESRRLVLVNVDQRFRSMARRALDAEGIDFMDQVQPGALHDGAPQLVVGLSYDRMDFRTAEGPTLSDRP